MKKILTFLTVILTVNTIAGTVIVSNTNDSGAGSLRMAISSASAGDTIRFSNSLISGGSNVINLSSTISCNKSIVVKGLYNFSDTLFISAPITDEVFNLNLSSLANRTALFDSVCLVNSGGGIIFTGDTLSIENSLFKGHRKSVINANSMSPITRFLEVKIKHSIFKENTDSISSSVRSLISATSGTSTTISDARSIVHIQNCEISDNVFLGYLISSQVSMPISSTLSQKTHSKIKITNSKIFNNSITNGNPLISSQTYGMPDTVLNTACMEVLNSEIENNSVLSTSSILRATAFSYFLNAFSSGELISKDNTFSNNIGTVIRSRLISVKNSTFYNNTSQNSGAIYSYGGARTWTTYLASFVNVVNCTFIKNRCLNPSAPGAIFSKSAFPSGNTNINLKSSIFHSNGTKQFKSNNTNTIISQGNNVFSDSILSGTIASDQLNIDSISLKLDTLKNNGGNTKTMIPLTGSVAIDLGNSSDVSDAQNRPIKGRRDVGSAEGNCHVSSNETRYICGQAINWRGNIYSTLGNYKTVVVSPTGCDSVINLDVKKIDNSISLVYPYFRANMNSVSYQWLDCFNSYSAIPGETSQYFTIPVNGSYAVEVSINGCIDTSICRIISNVSLDKNNKIEDAIIYPNPNVGNFILDLGENKNLNQIFITDINGRLIKEIIPSKSIL